MSWPKACWKQQSNICSHLFNMIYVISFRFWVGWLVRQRCRINDRASQLPNFHCKWRRGWPAPTTTVLFRAATARDGQPQHVAWRIVRGSIVNTYSELWQRLEFWTIEWKHQTVQIRTKTCQVRREIWNLNQLNHQCGKNLPGPQGWITEAKASLWGQTI